MSSSSSLSAQDLDELFASELQKEIRPPGVYYRWILSSDDGDQVIWDEPCPYEQKRLKRIARNAAFLDSLGLGSGITGFIAAAKESTSTAHTNNSTKPVVHKKSKSIKKKYVATRNYKLRSRNTLPQPRPRPRRSRIKYILDENNGSDDDFEELVARKLQEEMPKPGVTVTYRLVE